MDFYYKKIPIIDLRANRVIGNIYRPIIKVGLKSEPNGKDDFVDYDVLIDSGADNCIFPADLAVVAGINFRRGEKRRFGGLGGGSVIGYKHNIVMDLGGHVFPVEVYFASNLQGYGILGQKGFFEKFRIRFIYSRKKVEIVSE